MKAKLIAICTVSILTLVGCGSIPGTSAIDSQSDFTTLALVTNNPNLSTELNALKDLPADQRQAKLNELKNQYPVDFTAMQNMMNSYSYSGGMMGYSNGMMGNGNRGGMMNLWRGNRPSGANLQNLATTNPEAAKELKALQDEYKAKVADLKAKYPDAYKPQPKASPSPSASPAA